jgi:hypothetical protein
MTFDGAAAEIIPLLGVSVKRLGAPNSLPGQRFWLRTL